LLESNYCNSCDNFFFIDKERKVTVSGTTKQIELALIQIKNKVKEANESRNELNCESTIIIKRISDSPYNNNTNISNNISKPALEQGIKTKQLIFTYMKHLIFENLYHYIKIH